MFNNKIREIWNNIVRAIIAKFQSSASEYYFWIHLGGEKLYIQNPKMAKGLIQIRIFFFQWMLFATLQISNEWKNIPLFERTFYWNKNHKYEPFDDSASNEWTKISLFNHICKVPPFHAAICALFLFRIPYPISHFIIVENLQL